MFQKTNSYILKNLAYLFSDNIIRLIISFIISVFIARHFGPSRFGQINYVLAVIGILQVIVFFGFDSNVLKDLGIQNYKLEIIIGTVIKIRLVIAFLCYLFGALITYFILDKDLIYLYLILGIQLFFYILYIYKLYFQVKALNKYTVYAQQLCFFFVSICKILIIIFDKSIFLLSICITIGTFLEILMLEFGFSKSEKIKKTEIIKSYDINYAKQLVKYSLPLLLQNCAIIIYMKIDQIMIGRMLSTKEVGIYSISVTISEMVHFIPMSINNAVYPKIVEQKKNNQNYKSLLVKLGSINMTICILFSLFCTFIIPFFITQFYGEAYSQAINVIRIHCWATLFVAIGVSHDSYIVFENKQHYSMLSSVISCIMNIILNYFLIKLFSINGAAIATLISQFFASYLFYAFCKNKETFKLRTKSILFYFK